MGGLLLGAVVALELGLTVVSLNRLGAFDKWKKKSKSKTDASDVIIDAEIIS